MKSKILFLGLTLLSALNTNAQLIEHQVLPSATDNNINGNNPPHYAYLDNGVNQINKLLLFIPGTNATPWDYRMFQQTAANLGYHSIGLTYENLQSININICPATQDPTCHGRARREVWFGEDTHDSISVNYDNSIINRFLKLLKYLDINYPNENWGQYLINDTTVYWQSVVIAGHSQGAGHATFGSKFFPMHRVIMLSWVDWMWPGTNPLWVTQPGQTPDSAYFGFIHTGDASIYSGIPTTWTNLGMNPYGAVTNIDNISPPYNNTHSLITSAPINQTPTQTNYHNATCVDWVTTLTQTGDTLYKPVWKYLLGYVNPVLGIEDNHFNEHHFKVYPNPATNTLTIVSEFTNKLFTYKIINTSGSVVLQGDNPNKIDLKNMASGLYLVQIQTENVVSILKLIIQQP